MEQEWRYKISEKQVSRLVKSVSKFYDPRIDIEGYIITLMEEDPKLDIPNAYRILSSGNGKPKTFSSDAQKKSSFGIKRTLPRRNLNPWNSKSR